MVKRFKHGFSLAEIVTVMAVIGVISALALGTTIRQDKLKEKQIETTTQSFYASVDSSYNQILNYNATNGDVRTLEDQDSNAVIDGRDLRKLFNKYMDGEDIDCSKLGVGININSFAAASTLPDGSVFCSEHPGNVIAGYYLNTACNISVDAKNTFTRKDDETKKADTTSKRIDRACGSIVYGIAKNKRNQLGETIFVIPLGKIGLRQ